MLKCPDCQGNLLPVSLTGFDDSYRCRVCGGFWMLAWTLAKAAEEEIDKFTRLGLKPEADLLTNKCPKDGSQLEVGNVEVVPQSVASKKCPTCGWWWMPGDSLFDYRAAIQAKKSYFQWWGGKSDLVMTFLPAIMVLVMLVGGIYGTLALYKRTQFAVPARTAKTFFSIIYTGRGNARVDISSSDVVREVELWQGEKKIMTITNVAKINGVYQVNLFGLVEGVKYQLRVNEQMWEFVASEG